MRILTATITLLALSACGGPSENTTTPSPTNDTTLTANEPGAPSKEMDASTMPVSADTRTPTAEAGTTRWEAEVRQTPQGGYVMGNPAAKVKLVEYGSRTCPACARFAGEGMRALASRYVSTGKVSYEFRDFIIHGGPDIAASIVGRCGTPATYFPVLEATFAEQGRSLPALDSITDAERKALAGMPVPKALAWMAEKAGYVDIAAGHGIPKDQSAQCLADEKAAQKLVDRTNAAKEVEATPTFILNGKVLGVHDWAGVEAALKSAGA